MPGRREERKERREERRHGDDEPEADVALEATAEATVETPAEPARLEYPPMPEPDEEPNESTENDGTPGAMPPEGWVPPTLQEQAGAQPPPWKEEPRGAE